MMQNDFVFEKSPWERRIDALAQGAAMQATDLLALMEGEDDDAFEDALSALREKKIELDIGSLPKFSGDGQTAVRLRTEQQLQSQGRLLQGLEENDPLRVYLTELTELHTQGDAQLLAQKCAGGDETAMQKLADISLPKVTELACEMTGYGILLLDLIQEGSMGLWQSILTYREGDFAAHRDYWIRSFLTAAVLQQARAGGIGQKLRQGMQDYRDMDEQLLTQLGRNPTTEEIADRLHISQEDAQVYGDMLNMARMRKQIDDMTAKPAAEEDDQAVENTAYYQSRQRIEELLSTLSEKEAQLLTYRFGLDGKAPLSPQEAGQRLCMTPDEVIAAEAAALNKLRK